MNVISNTDIHGDVSGVKSKQIMKKTKRLDKNIGYKAEYLRLTIRALRLNRRLDVMGLKTRGRNLIRNLRVDEVR
jgi:hypothetical protein